MESSCESPLALGFLTVVDQAPHGLVGGYLVVDARARPIEFHCTAPVRPNRAQEILYGATLGPYLYGEQIGQTLVNASKLRPQAVFTDCAQALAAAPHLAAPVWLVLSAPRDVAPPATAERNKDHPSSESAVALDSPRLRIDAAQPVSAPAGMSIMRLGHNLVAREAQAGTSSGLQTDAQDAVAILGQPLASTAAGLDLNEPFERIRAAIAESQRGGR